MWTRANRGVRSWEAVERLKQTRRRNCGQTCLAMVSGLSVEEVERTLGKTGSTRTKDLVRWLRARGWRCPDRLVPFQQYVPTLCIAKLARRRPDGRLEANWHWVVLTPSGALHDPSEGSRGVLTSYLPLTKSGTTRSARARP